MVVHNFRESLALSHEFEDAPWWESVYQKAFPKYMSAVSVRNDGWAQRGGIDRVITLESGKTITIDEKVRAKSYGDIALEQWSDRDRKTPGWMQKSLACDFIAYAFVPDRICYLFSFPLLRKAWLDNGREWLKNAELNINGYRFVDAQNKGYVTRSVAVPIPDLTRAISKAQIISWGEYV